MRQLFILLSLCIASMGHGQPTPKLVPPVTTKAPDTDVPKQGTTGKQEITVTFPPSINLNVSGQTKIQAEGKLEGADTEAHKWADPANIIALLLFCATVVLAIANWKLVTGTDNNARRQLRAYIALNNIYFQREGLKVKVENYGQTPAHDMTIWTWTTDEQPERGFVYDYPAKAPTVREQMLHPRQWYAHPASMHLPYTYMSAGFFPYGKVVYRDVFGQWWATRFCYLYEGDNSFEPWGDHNREDGPYKTREEALT